MIKIKDIVKRKEYNFLKTNEHLKGRIIFLTLGGSHGYGTNIETSDIDIRGCAVARKHELIGLSNFEQMIDLATDTTIYSFNKLISLLLNCNPNTIELLGCNQYYNLTRTGQELLDNRKMFLSKRAVNSFGGFATSQLRGLKNAIAKDSILQLDKDELRLNKHAMHLVRLYLMAIDIFEKEEIVTYRANDLDLLMSIRNGKFMNEDGTYHSDFFDMVTDFENRLSYAMKNTSLPDKPNFKEVEEFVISVHERVIKDEKL